MITITTRSSIKVKPCGLPDVRARFDGRSRVASEHRDGDRDSQHPRSAIRDRVCTPQFVTAIDDLDRADHLALSRHVRIGRLSRSFQERDSLERS